MDPCYKIGTKWSWLDSKPAKVGRSQAGSGGDATCMQALGPALATLLVVSAAPRAHGCVTFTGDSKVVQLLHRFQAASILWLCNCWAMVHDVLRR